MSRKLLPRPNQRKFFKLSAIAKKVRQHRFKPVKGCKNMLASTLGAELKSSPVAPNSCFCKHKRVDLHRKVNPSICCSQQVRYNRADDRRKVESVLLERGHKFISKQLSCNALHQLVKSVDVKSRNLLNLFSHQQSHDNSPSTTTSVQKNVAPVVHITSTCQNFSEISNNKKGVPKSFRNYKHSTPTESYKVLLRKNYRYLKPSKLLSSYYLEPRCTGFQLIRNCEEPESVSDSQPSAIYDELFRIAEAKFDIEEHNEDTLRKSDLNAFHVPKNVQMHSDDSLMDLPVFVSRTDPPVPSDDPLLGLFGSLCGSDASLPYDGPLMNLSDSYRSDPSRPSGDQLVNLSGSVRQTDVPVPSDDPLLGLFGSSTRIVSSSPCGDPLVNLSDSICRTDPTPSDDPLVDSADSSFQTEPPIPSNGSVVDIVDSISQTGSAVPFDDPLLGLFGSCSRTDSPVPSDDYLMNLCDSFNSTDPSLPSDDPLVGALGSSSQTDSPVLCDDPLVGLFGSSSRTDSSVLPDDPLVGLFGSSSRTDSPVLPDDPLVGLFGSSSRTDSLVLPDNPLVGLFGSSSRTGSPVQYDNPLVNLFGCNQPILLRKPLMKSYGTIDQSNPPVSSNDSLEGLPDTFSLTNHQ